MTTPLVPLHRPYVFARPIAFDLECPNCGTLDAVRRGRPPWREGSVNFNPLRSRWRCRACRHIFVIGLALWRVSRTGNQPPMGVARPADTVPTLEQMGALRQLLGVAPGRTRGRGDAVNLVCRCLGRDDFDPDCPYHGWEA